MNKKLTKILGCGACVTMAAIFTAGCVTGGTGAGENPETRPFVVAIGATDLNFNPFFATSQYDVQVTELTQISMLNADQDGNVTYGENEPTVVLDYKETFYNAHDEVVPNGDKDGKTVYEFVIKNGIKYSDGKPLTIKDVLFNLYVYLDPVYFGSSTIYSTDIIGLNAYRTQDPTAGADSDISSYFDDMAQSRINYLMAYLDDGTISTETDKDKLEADKKLLQKLYREEVESDWTSNYGTLDSYTEEFSFTSNWEIFYYAEGLIDILYDKTDGANWVERKDANGKYLTDLDEGREYLREDMEEALNDASLIAAAKAKYNCSDEEARGYVERDTAIETVYKTKAESGDKELLKIFTQGWATSGAIREQFSKDAMTEYYEQVREDNDGQLLVPSISGINAITSDKSVAFKDKYSGYDILQVQINGVDPKAIWNMAFQVAPSHYYSGSYKGTDYTKIDIDNNQFGVCFGDANFFDDVLGDDQKSLCPVGAGAYKACTEDGNETRDGGKFHNNKVNYYMRNDYFTTVGSGISNAKIKYVRYKEVEEANLVSALKTGDVDYGEPSCTPGNISSLNSGARVDIGYRPSMSAGYGYVGINAKKIPDIEVRRAIMKAMNVDMTAQYYGSQYASTLHRPMSKANWVYTEQLQTVGSFYGYENDADNIWDELASKGWTKNSAGVGTKDGRTLKFTFTIAGGTSDHPAYGMFNNAARILNRAGFDITVTTSQEALRLLATGGLTVWAAAYTSPIDPDLYQLYHKDSKASSVKNWGYDAIKQNTSLLYGEESAILDELSELIVKARQGTAHSYRGPLYKQALDLIMELAIQLPTYQRNDLSVYNSGLLDTNTLNTDPSAYAGVLNRIWEVDYRK